MSVSNQTTISTKLGFFNLRNLTVSLITLVFITLLYLTNQGSKYYTNNIVLPLYHPKMLIFHPNITPIINSSKTYTLPVNVPPQSCWKRSFQELLEPCKDSLSWTSRITDINLKTNLALSKIDTYFGPAGKTSFVKISTYDNMNRKKRRGGDSWWVTVTGSISFHVVMFDNLDGSYTGWFDFVQPGTYDVRIDLKYSLCDGYRDPPVWWFKVGTDHGKYQKPGVLGGQKDFMHQSKKFTVTISGNKSIGDPNNIDNAYINDDCGYWIGSNNYVSKKRTFGPIKTHKRDGTIWFYGDSLQVRYENYFGGRPLCTQYFRCSVTYTWLYPNPHPSRKIYDNKDFDKNIPLNDIKAVLNNPVMKKNTSVLFVNWGLHVVLDLPFDVLKDFFQSFLTIVKELKQASPDAFPQIIWKSTTPTYEREYYDRNSGGSNAEADHIRFLTKQVAYASRLKSAMNFGCRYLRTVPVALTLVFLVFITMLYLNNQGSKYYTTDIIVPQFLYKKLLSGSDKKSNKNSNTTHVPPKTCWKRSFEELLKPCKDSLSWTSRITDKTLKTNLTLSKIDTYFGPAGKTSFVKILTYDNMNRKKHRGGDSWWVTVIGEISFHVDMFDNLDGSYTGWFEFVQPGTYDVRIDLKYSLCDGYRDPPVWWFKVGTDHGKYQKQGVLGGQRDFMHQSKKLTTTISGKTILDDTSDIDNAYINDDCGYWIGSNNYVTRKRTFEPIKTHKRDGTIWFYGDSLQVRYEGYFRKRPLCTQYFRCSTTYTWLYPNPHPPRKIYNNKDFNKNIPLNDIKAVLNNPVMKKNTSVLFVNWGLHVLMILQFDVLKDFFQSFLALVKELKYASPDTFPQIIWRSTTSMYEREYYDDSGGKNHHLDHLRFLTNQRVMLWNAYTREQLEKSGIKIVNFFNLAASYAPGPVDRVHFPGQIFESTAVAFEQYILSTI